MKRCTVEHVNFTRECGNRIQVRCQILFYRIPQFICKSKSERIIEIGLHLPKLSQRWKWHLFYGPRCI